MPWQAIILLQNIFASAYALQSRDLAKRYKKAHFQILAATFAVLYVVFLGYGYINIESVDLPSAAAFAPSIVAVAVLLAIWTILTFITLRYVDAAVGTLFAVLNIVAVAVIATLFLGEGLSALQLFGAALLVVSIIYMMKTKVSKKTRQNFHIALVLSMVASISFGFAVTLEKSVLDGVGLPTYAVVGGGAQFLVLLLVALVYNRRQFFLLTEPKFAKKVLTMGLLRASAGLLFLLSMVAADNASLIGMLSGFKIILTALFAAILLKEVMFIRRKLVAATIAFVGVGLMLWP